MKRRILAVLTAGVLSMAMLAGCGGSAPAPAETTAAATEAAKSAEPAAEEKKEETTAEEKKEEAVEEEKKEEAVEEEEKVEEAVAEAGTKKLPPSATEKASSPMAAAGIEDEAEAAEVEPVYVDGYYANNGKGSDMMLAFYEVGDVDIAYATDGEYEFWSQYTVEEAVTDEGNEYLLVSFTDVDAQLGYVDNGDGEYYLVDENGETYLAGQLTEEEAEEIYNAVQNPPADPEAGDKANADAEETEADTADAEPVFVDGYYANNGESDMMLAFFEVGDVDVAYATDGENEFVSQYTVEEAVTDEGNEYLLVSFTDVDAQLGYVDNGDGEYYLVDEEGKIYAAAQLTEEEVSTLYDIVQSSAAGEGENAVAANDGATEAAEETEADAEADAAEEATEAAADNAGEADVTYDTGFYVDDGEDDFILCFFNTSDGKSIAYLYNGEEELFSEYELAEAETEDGFPYMLVTIGDATVGFATDGDTNYLIDAEGNVVEAVELTEEQANAILEEAA